MRADKLAQSYVFPEDGSCYFVSTLNRNSLSVLSPGRYSETFVWDYDQHKRARGELVYETDDRVDSIHRHREVVEGIFSLGFGKFLAQENAEDSE